MISPLARIARRCASRIILNVDRSRFRETVRISEMVSAVSGATSAIQGQNRGHQGFGAGVEGGLNDRAKAAEWFTGTSREDRMADASNSSSDPVDFSPNSSRRPVIHRGYGELLGKHPWRGDRPRRPQAGRQDGDG